MRKICIWPDGTWCFVEILDEYNWKSDDYYIEEVSDNMSEDDIDDYVHDATGE